MLQLFITPTSIVFENLTDELMHQLQWKYGLEFTVEENDYKIEDKPEYLYKLLLKLTYDYDIELN